MDRRQLGLVLAIAASVAATAGAVAFAQDGSGVAASDSAVAPAAAVSAVAPRMPGGASAVTQPASDQAVASVASGVRTNCAVPSTALPPASGILSSNASSAESSLMQGSAKLESGAC